MDSSLYLKYSTLILKCILERECLDASVSDHTLEISYAFLYYLGGEDARYMEYIVSEACVNQQNQLFRKIILELQSFTGGYPLMSISFKLLFEMGKIAQASEADLGENRKQEKKTEIVA